MADSGPVEGKIHNDPGTSCGASKPGNANIRQIKEAKQKQKKWCNMSKEHKIKPERALMSKEQWPKGSQWTTWAKN